ncbi:uncharacterized protein LOC108916905 [Anoplophora glabripennis]|uniref:uncharacterized protein LOC108916905 n=1 Tax=Anoplophora glabripennis TaxID=217634 RepID=UPI0008745AA2|nr:uncharacterized protein LOC108916905 [Anoplophora glabripennis]
MASHSVNLTVSCCSSIGSTMLTRILAMFSVSLIITRATEGAPAVATGRQFLPALPGYVPVYIRTGDTPLEEINPDLAEAFGSYSSKHARKAFSRSNNAISDKQDDLDVKETDVSLGEDSSTDEATQKVEVVYGEPQHIQKIPRT